MCFDLLNEKVISNQNQNPASKMDFNQNPMTKDFENSKITNSL